MDVSSDYRLLPLPRHLRLSFNLEFAGDSSLKYRARYSKRFSGGHQQYPLQRTSSLSPIIGSLLQEKSCEQWPRCSTLKDKNHKFFFLQFPPFGYFVCMRSFLAPAVGLFPLLSPLESCVFIVGSSTESFRQKASAVYPEPQVAFLSLRALSPSRHPFSSDNPKR